MIDISIIGTGNVARHLFKAFYEAKGVRINWVITRKITEKKRDAFREFLSDDFGRIEESDITILSVNDDAIAKVAKKIKDTGGLLAHTSGNTSISELLPVRRRGVFYPLQSFSAEKEIDYRQMPLCLEANTEEDLILLKKLAASISSAVYQIDSEQRSSLHLSAVFINNFSNHMVTLGKEICQEQRIPFEIFQPLLNETFEKLERLSPEAAQTGPALRNDQKTINSHLQKLGSGIKKDIYEILTRSIQNSHGKKL
ncbi:Rossmann-like and DUF2520 domain-containing protein [Robertkochia aurantiaca]|uniref:Rossmann-like and DUF2520 domain-containing protein n=1 Tax=Robertkochia aurantiaca TaxID=2873700 RepID=UPI001CCEF6AF|nr:Rossmann-like and DUF2520 domain-containing protein [Robertkochia sp. 3YJGBD-33]